MGHIDFRTEHMPCVVVKGQGKLGIDECKVQCEGFEKLMAEDARYVSVIDYRGAKLAVTPAVSTYLGSWALRHREAMARCSPVSVILLDSKLVALIVNPILKLMRLPNPVRIFNSGPEALTWLRQESQRAGLDVPVDVRI